MAGGRGQNASGDGRRRRSGEASVLLVVSVDFGKLGAVLERHRHWIKKPTKEKPQSRGRSTIILEFFTKSITRGMYELRLAPEVAYCSGKRDHSEETGPSPK